MTIDIDAIRRRQQAADSGPWRVVEEHGRDIADEAYTRLTVQTAIHYGESGEIAEMVDPDHDWASKLPEENAEFIAHARTDIPALLAELDRVRANRDQVADSLSAVWDALGLKTASDGNAVDAIRELRAELDRVRAEVAAARAERDEYAHDNRRVVAQLTAANHHTDGLAADVRDMQKANTAYANENARLREQVFAQQPVIEAAEAWGEAWEGLKGNDAVPYAIAQPSATLHDAVEQYRLMDLALTSARAEAEVAR